MRPIFPDSNSPPMGEKHSSSSHHDEDGNLFQGAKNEVSESNHYAHNGQTSNSQNGVSERNTARTESSSINHIGQHEGVSPFNGPVTATNGVHHDATPTAATSSATFCKAKVVVVGAGIAGVTAAAKLVQNGIKDVIVLEAQEYIGGRIQAHVVGDDTLDMGAMFVHGQEGNPIYEIVSKLEIEAQQNPSEESIYYTSKGEKIPNEAVDEVLDFIEENKRSMPAVVGQNKGAMMIKLYNKFLEENHISEDHPKKQMCDAALRYFLFYECTEEACRDLNEVSAWSDINYSLCAGNQYLLIKGGYTTVINSLLDLIPKGIIRTRTPVHSIDWGHCEESGILVTCENGDTYRADHVICTISMGCLKHVHKSLFSPSLPITLSNTFERLEMGSIGKIFLKWDSPFWNEKEDVIYDFLWFDSSDITIKQDKSCRKTCMAAIKDLDDQEVMSVLHELLQLFVYDVDIPKPSAMFRTNWENNPYTQGTYTYCLPSFDSSDVEQLNRPVFPSKENPRLLFAGESFTIKWMTTTHGAFTTGEEQADRILRANGTTESTRVVDSILSRNKLCIHN